MGRRRGKRHASATTKGLEDAEEENVLPIKRRKILATSLNLSEEQEDRLGRLSSSVQWIIKIAQDRGSNTCLALSSNVRSECNNAVLRVVMNSLDGQQVEILAQGIWTSKFQEICVKAGNTKSILLSGLGAKLSSSGSEVIYDSGNLVAECIDTASGASFGPFEVRKGSIVKEPVFIVEASKAANGLPLSFRANETAPDAAEADAHFLPAREESAGSTDAIRKEERQETIVPEGGHARIASSVTPSWLQTPAVETSIAKITATNEAQKSSNKARSSSSARASTPKSAQLQQLGNRIYTPISMLECDDRKIINVIGLITTDHPARRALSGTQDWKVTIGLVDVEAGKDVSVSNISFNLFSRQEQGLPRCKSSSILLLQGVKIRAFNSYPQGNGYPGQFEWAFMDTSESDPRQALQSSEKCILSEGERKEMKRQYDYYRKRNKGQLQPAKRKSTRPLISLNAVEKETFFDTIVEIVKIWSRSLPPEIYVTDYSTHPLFYATNDVYLGASSREELVEQHGDSNDAGNGRVLPVSFWEDQQAAVDLLQVGMLVRLDNVRPKMQPNGFLSGTMGGGTYGREEKLRVTHVKDKKHLNDFAKRKQNYLEEVALKRAQKIAASDRSMEQREDKEEERSELVLTSESSTLSMPPPGQRALTEIENCSDVGNRTGSSGKTFNSEESEDNEELAPTLIEESMSSIKAVSPEELERLTTEQLRKGTLHICEGRISDMLPRNIEEIVEVTCGLCKVKLPLDHSFCVKCAEEDGKDLRYRFNFAFLVEHQKYASGARKSVSSTDPPRLAVLIRGEAANQFLHGFIPKDVHNRAGTIKRLQKRLLPLLGSKLVYGQDSSLPEQKPQPFRFGVRGSLIERGDDLYKRFSLVNTRLVSASSVAAKANQA